MSLKFSDLKAKLDYIQDLVHAACILQWDQEVYMPKVASEHRGRSLATIESLAHAAFTSQEFEKIITELNGRLASDEFSDQEKVIIRETYKDFEKQKKIPNDFVNEFSNATASGYVTWVEARKNNDFKSFLPHLQKLIELSKKKAEFLGFSGSPYNALLDLHEPGLKTDELDAIFEDLKNFLIPFVKKVSGVYVNKLKDLKFDIEDQKRLSKKIIEIIPFDENCGRLDQTAHPFCSTISAKDIRLTTRYNENDLMESISSVIHEAGHGMYEQGLSQEWHGTPYGQAASLGVHESQSRFWENMVGKSYNFWSYLYPITQEHFPQLKEISLDDFYHSINCVKPSLIRTESDEVTYNLHIIIRYEIERGLIEGTIDPKDLPEIWNDKYEEYLGIRPENDSMGVLQDVHWSHGSFGYFPTYTLGNLYSAQIHQALKNDLLSFDDFLKTGKLAPIKDWLNENIHRHGRKQIPSDLIISATKLPISADYFKNYLTKKFSDAK